MFVITESTLTTVREAYHATGSLATATALLQREFRVLTEVQGCDAAAYIVSAAPDPTDDPQPPHPG